MNIVCDVEYAKKLKELGVNQNSIFYWNKYKNLSHHNKIHEKYIWQVEDDSRVLNIKDTGISAFTTDELLEMLPDEIWLDKKIYYVEISKHVKIVSYQEFINNQMLKAFGYKKKLPNALSKLLIFCIENGYTEVNKDA